MVPLISFFFLSFRLPEMWDLSLGSEKGRQWQPSHHQLQLRPSFPQMLTEHIWVISRDREEAETAWDGGVRGWKGLEDRWSTAHFPGAPRAWVICSRSPICPQLVNSWVPLFNKYLVSTHRVLDPVQCAGELEMSKTWSCPTESTVCWKS